MTAIGWQKRLNEADTPEQVAEVCREFLLVMTPAALEEIPESCRPPVKLDIGDISPFALRLIRQLDVGDRATAPVLHELTAFFTKAALRLAILDTGAEPGRMTGRG